MYYSKYAPLYLLALLSVLEHCACPLRTARIRSFMYGGLTNWQPCAIDLQTRILECELRDILERDERAFYIQLLALIFTTQGVKES